MRTNPEKEPEFPTHSAALLQHIMRTNPEKGPEFPMPSAALLQHIMRTNPEKGPEFRMPSAALLQHIMRTNPEKGAEFRMRSAALLQHIMRTNPEKGVEFPMRSAPRLLILPAELHLLVHRSSHDLSSHPVGRRLGHPVGSAVGHGHCTVPHLVGRRLGDGLWSSPTFWAHPFVTACDLSVLGRPTLWSWPVASPHLPGSPVSHGLCCTPPGRPTFG